MHLHRADKLTRNATGEVRGRNPRIQVAVSRVTFEWIKARAIKDDKSISYTASLMLAEARRRFEAYGEK